MLSMRPFWLRKTPPPLVFWQAILSALIATLLASSARSLPLTYSGFSIAAGKLRSWHFHNARVYLTFQGDTSNVQPTQIFGIDVAYIGPFPAQQLCTGPTTS